MTTQPAQWTVRQCADHCGVQPGTWRDYVAKGRAPAATGHLDGRTPLWDADAVRAWHAGRPGHGGRPRRAGDPT